jgi:predicted RNA-binding Zn-ribbon protein involved in translation (DUF1610 family)
MSDSLVVRTEADDYKPVMSIDDMLYQRDQLRKYVNACLEEDTPGKADKDYGPIPGAGDRKVIHLPGAQKLCRMRGLSPDYEILSEDEDWTGERHGGEAFFNYKIKCILFREDRRMGSGVGACNSFEKKYRYTQLKRTCPNCGKQTINRSKDNPSFYCWKKIEGCGATFPANSPAWNALEAQPVGQTENPDPADLQNTILKMAKKRAYIDATLSVVGASEFFTQDVETEHKPAPPQQEQQQARPQRPQQRQPDENTVEAEFKQAESPAEPKVFTEEEQKAARKEFRRVIGSFDEAYADNVRFNSERMTKWVAAICRDDSPTTAIYVNPPSWEYATEILRAFKDCHPIAPPVEIVQAMQRQFNCDTAHGLPEFTDEMWKGVQFVSEFEPAPEPAGV